ncbi:MAG TPA: FAD-binding protein [Spirochaetota bacterium]|nr:FAD-binding protein [Spirochaetota bacterium]
MKIQIDALTITPEENENYPRALRTILVSRFNIPEDADFQVLRRSLDARKKNRIHYRFRVLADVDDAAAQRLVAEFPEVTEYHEAPAGETPGRMKREFRVCIVGSGPAGLFCALRLAESGCCSIVVERGKDVSSRLSDIAVLEEKGVLDEESNVLFGEGGAGTYSDGKLTTRTIRPVTSWFYEKIVEFGAPEEVLFDAKPHIGTDRLGPIVQNLRRYLESRGVEFRFRVKVDDILIAGGEACGVHTSAGEEILADAVVIATGHSARDIYALLANRGVPLAAKGFAAGVRVEHPAELISFIQYGRNAMKGLLPGADYFLAWNNPSSRLGVYSFCMCPGGAVINSSSEQGRLCTNGMSYSGRNGEFSNAALVVTVAPSVFDNDPMKGIAFQREIEEAAFREGGGGFMAPAQRLDSFLKGKSDGHLPDSSYRPGIVPGRAERYLPEWIVEELKNGLRYFNNKMKGFAGPEGILIGAETRTSSPVRIVRGSDMQSEGIPGLYPAGEGSGYAGGIVSSAVDGITAADAIIEHNS